MSWNKRNNCNNMQDATIKKSADKYSGLLGCYVMPLGLVIGY